MIKILVTGSSGMIGFHLLKKLSHEKKYKLYGIDRTNNMSEPSTYSIERMNYLKNLDSSIEFFNLDLCHNLIGDLISNIEPDIIVHLAAEAGVAESFKNPQKILYNNNVSFFNLLEAIRTIKPNIKLLYASSSSVYGNTQSSKVETNTQLCPNSSYGLSKLMNEQTAYLYSQNYGISSIGLRFFTVYGEYNRKDMFMHYLLESFRDNKSLTLYHNGLMERDFTYVGDVVNSIITLINDNTIEQHQVFNIGGTGSSSLNQVVEIMQQSFHHCPNIIRTDFIPSYDPLKTFCHNEKLMNKFPHLKFTPLNEGIDKLVKWYKSI